MNDIPDELPAIETASLPAGITQAQVTRDIAAAIESMRDRCCRVPHVTNLDLLDAAHN